jgi:hypothetical protein
VKGLKSGDAVVLQIERNGLLSFLAFRYEEESRAPMGRLTV